MSQIDKATAVKCPLCDSTQTEKVTDKVRFGKTAGVMTCTKCELVFLDQNSFELPPGFYENEYHQTYLTHIDPAAIDCNAYYQKMVKTTKPWYDKISAMLTGKETILDFGCSTGHVMKALESKAARVYGHELNTREIEFCRKELKLDVAGEDLERRFSKGMFDYIVMIFVLEHISEPVKLLQYLKQFLKPGGSFVILVPNVQDALVQFYDIPNFNEFYFCIEHLFYYSPKTLKTVFDMAGLESGIEVLQEYPVTNHLNWGYRQKPSDILASRRFVPDIALQKNAPTEDWEKFWMNVNNQYRDFLKQHGFGDRVWALAKKKV